MTMPQTSDPPRETAASEPAGGAAVTGAAVDRWVRQPAAESADRWLRTIAPLLAEVEDVVRQAHAANRGKCLYQIPVWDDDRDDGPPAP